TALRDSQHSMKPMLWSDSHVVCPIAHRAYSLPTQSPARREPIVGEFGHIHEIYDTVSAQIAGCCRFGRFRTDFRIELEYAAPRPGERL
ncbi:MAG: hypothetical protein ACYS8Z_15055, partial [Planctomycetota bacterium]